MTKKPKIWKMSITNEKNVEKSPYKGDFNFPCHKCIVTAACEIYCINVFNYMNFIAEKMSLMTADEIYTYRTTTPVPVKRKVKDLYVWDKRLAFPETAVVSRDWK